MARHTLHPSADALLRGRVQRRMVNASAGLALIALAVPSAALAHPATAAPAASHTTSFHTGTFWWLNARTSDGPPWLPSGSTQHATPTTSASPQPTATSAPAATPSATASPRATTKPRSTSTPTAPSTGSAAQAPSTGSSIPTSFPDAASTGPRSGHALAASGPLTITQAGAVVSNLSVDGCIDVKAPNVTITDVYIDCSRSTTAINVADGASATVQYTEINGNGVVSAAVGFANYTLSHVDIHDVIDGPRMNSNVQVLDSWVHGLARVSGSHNDALQTTGGTNIVVRGNTLQPYDPGTDDPHNAAVMIGSENQPLRNMTIEGNYLDGGNYSILARDDLNGANIVVRDNVYTRNFRYGPYRGATGMTADSTNVYADTRTSIF